MPGPISESYKGPGADAPYVPSWCYDDFSNCGCKAAAFSESNTTAPATEALGSERSRDGWPLVHRR
jgi:hypothetical protein